MLIRTFIHHLLLFSLFGLLECIKFSPPRITNNLKEKVYIREHHEFELECKAENGPLEYLWFKNGVAVTTPGESGNVNVDVPGLLRFEKINHKDKGAYFCQVSNKYGETRSNTSIIRIANMEMDKQIYNEEIEIPKHSTFKKTCVQAISLPKAEYYWYYDAQYFLDDQRRFVNDEGTLYFNYVLSGDQARYKCFNRNSIKDVTIGANTFVFKITDEEDSSQHSSYPELMYASGEKDNYEVKVLIGDNTKLSCFFSTRPVEKTFKYSWVKIDKDGNEISLRLLQKNFGINLRIESITEEDAGIYICRCHSGSISSEKKISLIVESKPLMRRDSDSLKSLYVIKGDDAEFNCNPFAIPPPIIYWSLHSKHIAENTAPPRWSFDGPTKLKVRNAQKNDTGVVMCNVTNKHARYFYSAVFVVLEPTIIVTQPLNANVSYLHGPNTVQYMCEVKFDDNTELSLRWWFLPENKNTYENLHSKQGVKMFNQNQTLLITVENSTEWINHKGQYMCLADNGYSKSNSSAFLLVTMPIKPKMSPLAQAAAAWYLILIVLLLVLLLMLLVCCCCLYKNRGGVYKVDKKERFIGNDPDKELKEGEFKDYQRPSGDLIKGSRASLGSSIPMNSDDEGSLNEYGDIDAGKFGEDGSFIGDYNTERRNRTAYSNGNGVANGNAFNSFGANGYQRV